MRLLTAVKTACVLPTLSPALNEAMTDVVDVLNFIKTRPLKEKMCKAARKFGDNQFSDETGLPQRYIWEAE